MLYWLDRAQALRYMCIDNGIDLEEQVVPADFSPSGEWAALKPQLVNELHFVVSFTHYYSLFIHFELKLVSELQFIVLFVHFYSLCIYLCINESNVLWLTLCKIESNYIKSLERDERIISSRLIL